MSRIEIVTNYSDKGHCRMVSIAFGTEVDRFHVDAAELNAAALAGEGSLLALVYDNSTGHILRYAAERGVPVLLDGVPLERGLLREAVLEGVA